MKLNSSEELLRNTIDSSMDMIQVFETVRNEQDEIIDFTWILNNKTSEAIYGDVIGKSLLTSIEEFERIAPKHRFRFQQGQLNTITADKERITQVLSNVLSNAVKYSRPGSDVIITTSDMGDSVRVSVQDFGIGIAPQAQAGIFDRFHRVNNVRTQNYPGMGLGLFISADIIRRHGGHISVTSEENQGATFTFTIPYNYSVL